MNESSILMGRLQEQQYVFPRAVSGCRNITSLDISFSVNCFDSKQNYYPRRHDFLCQVERAEYIDRQAWFPLTISPCRRFFCGRAKTFALRMMLPPRVPPRFQTHSKHAKADSIKCTKAAVFQPGL